MLLAKRKIRYLGASFIAFLLIGLGFTKRMKQRAINGEFILSIYFHSPSRELFEFCIKWLIRNNFNFLSQEDILRISNKSKPFPTASVVITVDDGWQTNEENIVVIADRYRIPVTIFVSTHPIDSGEFWWPYIDYANKMNITNHSIRFLKTISNKERENIVKEIKQLVQLDRLAMTVDQIKRISKSDFITIGSHTINHPILTNCNDDEVFKELKESKIVIENWINKKVKYFAYPNGDYSEREINYLKKLSYTLAYNTKPLPLTEIALQNLYELPRFSIFENISKNEAICRMLGVWQIKTSLFKKL
ncbi:polysaccharide deacetylase family protein [Mucilaginibacter arboris]|uniref:Polysaccharide deacetylase family protein n=1 Tax=Mucilaginibacter arboris TaxID=2682090 RepID=A0A7K1SXI6_9SPHI|nr:polysaccharide deacetylase family protein [Mucilaginibacter arboris]MVN22036.1 polysaccharide deacetylase family protein [Mucilaginibacter arboris]